MRLAELFGAEAPARDTAKAAPAAERARMVSSAAPVAAVVFELLVRGGPPAGREVEQRP